MSQAKQPPARKKSEREALRRRVTNMYGWLNQGSWEKCFSLLDPKLTQQGNVQLSDYAQRMFEFKRVYGSVTRWQIKISLHLDASTSKRDKRPFAYVYVIWQDETHGFHMFRERWVKESGRWFTRVVGLVPNRQESVLAQD